jgi:flavin-dependent dehydrogenase
MHSKPDVFVVGGGPAGLAVAIAARQRGFTVTVADGGEPPIDKACGEGLLPETQAALRNLGIAIPDELGFRFGGIRFVVGEAQTSARFPIGEAIGIRRTVLHELLIARAEKCGVKLHWKTPVTEVSRDGVRLGDQTVASRWIVGADGSGSRVRRWGGMEEAPLSSQRRARFACRRHYRVRPWADYAEIYWGEHAQAYVTPISASDVCVVVLADEPAHAKFEQNWGNWPALELRVAKAELISKERGAATLMRSLRNVWRGNVALVGDASGSVDAITGEGLRLAFQQGLGLADAMERGDLGLYQSAHRRLMRRPTWMGKLMLLMGRNAIVRERTMQSLATQPELFHQLLSIHVGASTTGRMIGAGARMGWGFLAA